MLPALVRFASTTKTQGSEIPPPPPIYAGPQPTVRKEMKLHKDFILCFTVGTCIMSEDEHHSPGNWTAITGILQLPQKGKHSGSEKYHL